MIGEREERGYRDRTRRSAELHERAKQALPLGRRELVPGLRPVSDVHDRCARQPHLGRRRQRVHRLRHGVRRPGRGPFASDPRRGAAAPRRERHLLHVPGRGDDRAGRGDQAPLRRRSRPLQQLGHRGHDGRDPRRARLHRSREDREVRGRLPRPPRRRARQHPAAARDDGRRGVAEHRPAVGRHPGQPPGGDDHRPVQPARAGGGHPRGAPRRDRRDHRRAGAVQHRRGAAGRRLPGAAARARHRARHRAHLRRGEDRRRHRLRRRAPSTSASRRTSSAWRRASAAESRSAPSADAAR